MKVSLRWLREYVDIDMTADALADALTMAGLEIDAVYDRFEWLGAVRVGRIVDVSAHPDADRLQLCQVDLGPDQDAVQIVCGAPNARQGLVAACALPGAQLPDGTVIRAHTIRGQKSAGMLCSAAELGLGDDADGLLELDGSLVAGMALNQAMDVHDTVFEIDLTPNRPDCLGMIGVAREVSAIVGRPLRLPDTDSLASDHQQTDIHDYTTVNIEKPQWCSRYVARLMLDVSVGPSPFWLQDRLISVGLKPINNIVDITNFVMMETGQPLHAFDFDALAENRIVVRAAHPAETLATLDQKTRTLTDQMLVICDADAPVGIAGLMGGLDSEIKPETTRVLLESACFNPSSIRKTAKMLGLATDASHRFERGVDPLGTVAAIDRAAQLMADIAGAAVVPGIIDAHPDPFAAPVIGVDTDALNRRLGTCLTDSEIQRYLESIDFTVQPTQQPHMLQVTPPSFRVDIKRAEDISEEIARLWGYDRIETTFPYLPADTPGIDRQQSLRMLLVDCLAAMGFHETINYSFINPDFVDRLHIGADDRRRRTLQILNPISEDQSVMRTSLIPGLLETVKRNLSVQNRSLRLFEAGKVFFNEHGQSSQPVETETAALLISGDWVSRAWQAPARECDFFDLKGCVENLLRKLGAAGGGQYTRLAPAHCQFTVSGHSAQISIGDTPVGMMGKVQSDVLRAHDIKQPIFICEIDLAHLMACLPSGRPSFCHLPRYPAVSRDITLIVDHGLESARICNHPVFKSECLIEAIDVFDVYEGPAVAAGKKSISIRVVYRDRGATLEDQSINQLHQRLAARLIDQLGATLPADKDD